MAGNHRGIELDFRGAMPLYLESMLPVELERHLVECAALVLPFGTIEWHSHHLPLGLDSIVAKGMGERMADAANAVLAPTGYWAVGGVPFPFTLNLSIEAVEPLLETVLQQFGAMGFAQIVLFTGHFGLDQTLATKRAALTEMRNSKTTILPVTTYDLVADFYSGDHAGVGETSLMMALQPELVHLDAWPAGQPLPGVIGEDPRAFASVDFGQRILTQSALRAAELLGAFREGRLSREAWMDVLEVIVRILEVTRSMRQVMGREQVPPITTKDYLAGWTAIIRGDFRDAIEVFSSKLATLERV